MLMKYEAIISDWNKTLTRSHEKDSNRRIGYTMLGDSGRAVLRGDLRKLPVFIGVLAMKVQTERRLAAYERGEAHLWDVYREFNRALNGQRVDYINSIADAFARENYGLLDERVLNPLRLASENGVFTGILSVGYDYLIRRTLAEAGFENVFDKIVANTLESDGGIAIGLTLGIYDRKAEVLEEEFFRKLGMGFNGHNTAYIGDSDDDKPIARILDPGNFVVSLLASDDFKQEMASECGAAVPENEADMRTKITLG
jgi:phosphoserine phosphatase